MYMYIHMKRFLLAMETCKVHAEVWVDSCVAIFPIHSTGDFCGLSVHSCCLCANIEKDGKKKNPEEGEKQGRWDWTYWKFRLLTPSTKYDAAATSCKHLGKKRAQLRGTVPGPAPTLAAKLCHLLTSVCWEAPRCCLFVFSLRSGPEVSPLSGCRGSTRFLTTPSACQLAWVPSLFHL